MTSEFDVPEQLTLRRPVENFPFELESLIRPGSWFERNRLAALQAMIQSSDDLRFNRRMVGMLSEAWDEDKFIADEGTSGADDLDRLLHIAWLQRWSTFIGLLTATDCRTIRFLSENGHRDDVTGHFSSLVKQEYPIIPNQELAQRTTALAAQGELIGAFSGSFDPFTFVHLSAALYYSQFCDKLVFLLDGDNLIKARKRSEGARYRYQRRHNIIANFTNVADFIAQVPDEIFAEGDYVDQVVSDFYRSLGIGIVFFNEQEPMKERREAQIRAAGALPYSDSLFAKGKIYSSTYLMELIKKGKVLHI